MLQLIKSSTFSAQRTFKTAWFAKAARKRRIGDQALCKAVDEVRAGKGVNLGGGVWKKRLNDNRDRSIILAQDGTRWFFVYLFMKKDRENISLSEERQFKALDVSYAQLSEGQLTALLELEELVEICHGDDG